MDEKEGWSLTEEEIKERLRQVNQQTAKRGPTRGGRSSGQGVKLLYIRDYLYAYATKERPQNAEKANLYSICMLKAPAQYRDGSCRSFLRSILFAEALSNALQHFPDGQIVGAAVFAGAAADAVVCVLGHGIVTALGPFA